MTTKKSCPEAYDDWDDDLPVIPKPRVVGGAQVYDMNDIRAANETPISDALFKFLAKDDPDFLPDAFEAQCAKYERGYVLGTSYDELTTAVGLKPGRKGCLLWPRADTPAGAALMRVVLNRLLHGMIDDEIVFLCMVRDTLAHNARPWRGNAFKAQVKKVLASDDARWEAERKAARSLAGRKPTDRTGRVNLIMETLEVSRRRAYEIERDGTASFEDRKALARAFHHDPKRLYPGAWEMMFASRQGRPRSRPTFAEYVTKGDADFEGYPALDQLKVACKLGGLPDTFRSLDAFIAALEPCGIAAHLAVAIWRIGGPWRDPN